MGKDKKTAAHRLIVLILLLLYKATFGLYIRLSYRLRSKSRQVLPKKGPYLLLANHCNNLDGLFLQCLVRQPIRFVVTDAMFKKKMLGALMSFVGYIPKRKHVADSGAIRQIIRAAGQGGIIGIFPEGGRNWDGKTGPISPTTFRLAKMLGVPVVTARIKGAYLSDPRWAETRRRGIVEIDFTVHHADKKAGGLLDEALLSALSHDEASWQTERRLAYKGKALTRGLDRLLFTCPACASLGTMRSSDERIACLSCGAAYRLDACGFLHAINTELPANSVSAVNGWQQALLAERVGSADDGTVILADEGARLYGAPSQEAPFAAQESGAAMLTKRRLSLGGRVFDTARIHGVSVYFKTHVEFRYDGLDYRIGFDDAHVSAYKWSCCEVTCKTRKPKNPEKNRQDRENPVKMV